MTREEAKERFYKEEEKTLVRSKEQTWEEVQKHAKTFKEVVMGGFWNLKEEAEKKQKEGLTYFQFSVLGVDLLQKKYTILLHGYDATWYLDRDAIMVSLSFPAWIQDRVPLWEALYDKAKIYRGKVHKYDIDNWMMGQMMGENGMLAHALRFLLKDIEKEPTFQTLKKEELFQIRFGEYRDKSEIAYMVDRGTKTQEDWEDALLQSKVREDHLMFRYWYGAQLKGGDCAKKMCQYMGAEKCHLDGVSFAGADLTGAKFLDCGLIGCSFEGADLTRADFTGSHAEATDFTGADLTDALFTEEAVPYLHLMPEQLQQIQIIGRIV